MAAPSSVTRLSDIIEAVELIRSEMTGVTLDAFESDRRKRWLVERGIEIISEASRRLPEALKAQHQKRLVLFLEFRIFVVAQPLAVLGILQHFTDRTIFIFSEGNPG